MSSVKCVLALILAIFVPCSFIDAMDGINDKQERVARGTKRTHSDGEQEKDNKKRRIDSQNQPVQTKSKWLYQEPQIVDLKTQHEKSKQISTIFEGPLHPEDLQFLTKRTQELRHEGGSLKNCYGYNAYRAARRTAGGSAMMAFLSSHGAPTKPWYSNSCAEYPRLTMLMRRSAEQNYTEIEKEERIAKRNGEITAYDENGLTYKEIGLINAKSFEQVSYWLAKGALPDALIFLSYGCTPPALEQAIQRNDPESVALLLKYDANPNAYYHEPLVMQVVTGSNSQNSSSAAASSSSSAAASSSACEKEQEETNRATILATLLQHNADLAIPHDPDFYHEILTMLYPGYSPYTYAVGRPKLLKAFKDHHGAVACAIKQATPLSLDCARLIAQYNVPIETGFIENIHVADAEAIQRQQNEGKITHEQAALGLSIAIALRKFTHNAAKKASLNAIARLLVCKERVNSSKNEHATLLQLAALSDDLDAQEYYQETIKRSSVEGASAAMAPGSTASSSASSSSSSSAQSETLTKTLLKLGAEWSDSTEAHYLIARVWQ